jgi:hypothetical protein
MVKIRHYAKPQNVSGHCKTTHHDRQFQDEKKFLGKIFRKNLRNRKVAHTFATN